MTSQTAPPPARWAAPAAVCALAVLVHLGKLANPLLQWDDRRFILNQPLVHSLVHWPRFFVAGQDGLYRPLRTLLYALSYRLFDGRAPGYQVVGLLLHAACCAAFLLLLRRAAIPERAAFLSALVFAVHPVHVERVAGITASYDLLGDGLLLAALTLYLDARDRSRPAWRRFLWAPTFVLALFSSEMALVFLPAAVLLDCIVPMDDRRAWREGLPAYVVAAGLSALYLLARHATQGTLGRGAARPGISPLYTLLTVARFDLHYLKLFVLHWRTAYFHDVPVIGPATAGRGLLALAVHAALLVAAVLLRRRARGIALGVFLFYAALLPFSQIVPNAPWFQERYAYLALAGWALVLGSLADLAWGRLRTRAVRIAAASVGAGYLLLLSATSWAAVALFRDDLALWSHAIAAEPGIAGGYNNLGAALLFRGRCDEALPLYRKAVGLDPGFTLAARGLAGALDCLDRVAEARQAYARFLELVPGDREALDRYCRLGLSLGETDETIRLLERRGLDPAAYPPSLLTLAAAYVGKGDAGRAREWLGRYLRERPGDAEALKLREMVEKGLPAAK